MVKITLELFTKNPFQYIDKISNKKLCEFIRYYADNYYNELDILISDEIFDKLVDILKQRDPNNVYFNTIGAPIKNNEVVLPFPMFSQNKGHPPNESKTTSDNILNWVKNHNSNDYYISDKLDGMSAMLYNKNLYKRGNGLKGQNINYLLDYINFGNKGINPLLSLGESEGNIDYNKLNNYAIRGELIISKNNFNKIKNEFKNARNAISGIINNKNPEKRLMKYVDFVAYNIVSPIMTQKEQYNKLKELGFNVVYNKHYKNIDVDELKKLTDERKNNGEYEIDGLVIVDNKSSYEIRKNKLESENQNPSYSIAFKYLHSNNIIQVEVLNVEWNVSRYNYLKPRINIKPIELMGSTIQYATGHNAKFIIDNKINKGSIIEITKSGEVIPKVINVIKPSKEPSYPNVKCHWNKTKVDLILDNEEENNDKILNQLVFSLQNLNVKWISEEFCKTLIKNNYKTLLDLFEIKDNEWKELFGNVQGIKMKNSLYDNVSKASLNELMASSGCFDRGLGNKNLKLIIDEIDILNDKITYDKIINIKGIGENYANNFIENINDFKTWYNKLNKYIKIEIKTIEKQSDKFQNYNIVLTGFRDKNIEEFIISNGGKCTSSVSKNTNILIIADYSDKHTSSAKFLKAKELNVKIYSKDEFIKEFIN